MSDTEWKPYRVINGFKYPPKCTQETADYVANYKPRDDDMFVVTYPKCGTTWTQQIIYLILDNGVPKKNSKDYAMDTYFEWNGDKTVMKPVIKTHLPYDMVPQNPSAKYLIVFRNPKDVVVSFYHHLNRSDRFPDFHYFFNIWINCEIAYEDFFEHNMSYWKHRNDPNVTYLVYEQMKRDPREAVLKIAEFLGHQYVDKLMEKNGDGTILDKVLDYSTIDYMKTDVSDENKYLLRKGTTGDWRNYFTKEESDQVDDKFNKYFKDTELESIWAEYMKW